MLDIQQEDDLEPMTMHEVSNAWTLVFDAYKKDSATNATALSDATYALVDKILNEYDTDPYIEIADIRNDLVAIALKEAAKQGEYVHNTVTRCRQSAKRYLNNLRMPIEQSNQEHILSNLKEEKELFEIRAQSDDVLREDQFLLRECIDMLLKTLNYRERETIKLRYGLGDGYVYTIDQAARVFKVSPGRIRELENKAVRKMQHPTRKHMLENF